MIQPTTICTSDKRELLGLKGLESHRLVLPFSSSPHLYHPRSPTILHLRYLLETLGCLGKLFNSQLFLPNIPGYLPRTALRHGVCAITAKVSKRILAFK